jgi:chorismate-pyruvate lyase
LVLALAGCATPHRATLREFEDALAAQDSATAALSQWCDARRIADPARIRALPVAGERAGLPPGLRDMLQVSADEPLGYRHVRLSCGNTILSEAHNWYVPGRLAAEMNGTLDSTDTPFGRVVAPLGFTRERIDSNRGTVPGCPQATILTHRAILKLPDGRPISLVVECYTPANLQVQ